MARLRAHRPVVVTFQNNTYELHVDGTLYIRGPGGVLHKVTNHSTRARVLSHYRKQQENLGVNSEKET